MKNRYRIGKYVAIVLCISPLTSRLQTKPEAQIKSWITKSNQYTALLIDLDKKYDRYTSVPTTAIDAAKRKERQLLLNNYTASLLTEKDLAVQHDLHILIDCIKLGLRQQDFEMKRIVSSSKARQDSHLIPEEYAIALEKSGVDIPPAELAALAHAMFISIQQEMQPIAKQIADQRHFPSVDYRDVIAELKKEQIHGDSILPLYEAHLKVIEGIIRQQQLVTLPDRPALIRLATATETVQRPAPSIVPPSFLNNTGQRAEFVLPLNLPVAPGGKETIKYDDFTFNAASWNLIVHEARPGHELQIDHMINGQISQARYLYALNPTNVEGWAMYTQYLMLPYLPIEGQLISLEDRLRYAASAFLEPEIQAGKITPQQALQVLMKDVVLSKGFAEREVKGYSTITPGESNSGYFYGFIKMIALRKDTETALGHNFNALRFHDFILSQGLLPPALMRNAIMKDFITAEKK